MNNAEIFLVALMVTYLHKAPSYKIFDDFKSSIVCYFPGLIDVYSKKDANR